MMSCYTEMLSVFGIDEVSRWSDQYLRHCYGHPHAFAYHRAMATTYTMPTDGRTQVNKGSKLSPMDEQYLRHCYGHPDALAYYAYMCKKCGVDWELNHGAEVAEQDEPPIVEKYMRHCYGHPHALAYHGAMLVNDRRRAAEQGYADAQNCLGEMYEKGRGVPKDEAEAAKWYRKAAEQGEAIAQCKLGDMYAESRGVLQDDTEAVRWYRKAAEQGNAEAQFNLGCLFADGYTLFGGVAQDDAVAVQWYRMAAEQGHEGAQYVLGGRYSDGHGVAKDQAEAAEWYRKAAAQGNARAQLFLGWMYKNGHGVATDDAEAVQWFRKAAEQGDADAQITLGLMCEIGEGVPKDEAAAVQWYSKAAEQGEAIAQCKLGDMYAESRGVLQDDTEAVRWYRKAAEQGNAEAQFGLGLMYAHGRGVPQDYAEAVRWYRMAAEQGNEEAKENLERATSSGKLGNPEETARQRRPGDLFTNSLGMKFAWIPPGTFLMGSPPNEAERGGDETRHKVTLTKGFYLGVHQVTQAQWQAVMGANPSHFNGESNLPVENVSWYDAVAFCEALGKKDGKTYRLPTEAEWEYACRAGTKTAFHFGKTISTDQANYDGTYTYRKGKEGLDRQKSTPVGSFPPNAWGLYDMHGNVWEWCADWYGPYPKGVLKDPQGFVSGDARVLRGGGWVYQPRDCRSASRDGSAPGYRGDNLGCRVVLCLD